VSTRGLTITGDVSANILDPYDLRMPKRGRASTLVMLFQTSRLRIAKSSPMVTTLADELAAFAMKVNPSIGNDSYEAWRESDHGNLVLSVARHAQEPAYSTGKDRQVRVGQRRGFRPPG